MPHHILSVAKEFSFVFTIWILRWLNEISPTMLTNGWSFYHLFYFMVPYSYFVILVSLRQCYPRMVFIKRHIQLLLLIAEAFFGPPQGVFSYESARSVETHKTFILTRELKRKANFVLSGMGIALLMNASIIFWELFLFEVSYICDDSIDCFALIRNDNETTTSLTPITITNCSLYDEDSDVKML